MYSWIESEIVAMTGGDYLALVVVLVFVCGFLLFYCYRAFRRFRYVTGTATSRVRSAAQGLVELKGLAEWLPGDTLISPFSNSRCIWYHCTIEKKRRSGKQTTWTNISDQCSEHLFRLVDETGSCIIDPDHAHVVPETDITWYGHDLDCQNRPPEKAQWINLVTGSYRFRERLIRPASELYALGWFRTVRSNPTSESISRQVEDLVKQWKLQPQRYLAEFDLDKNGKIQKGEWKVVRAAARQQVLSKIASENREHHLLSYNREGNHPFILSTTMEEELVAGKKRRAYASIAAAFVIFVAVVVMSSIRAPFPV